ncbi:MAG: hypothetical protein LUD72_06080, partial [Bacteroidales bacterium]|nr:hypothetical protein [Bacteroidales bacterium]
DGTVDVTLGTNETHTLTIRRRGQEQKLNSDKLYEVFAGATKEDYMPQKYTVEVPTDAVQGNYPNMIRCKFPDSSRYTGQHAVIPTIFKDEAKSNDEKVVFSIPDYINFSVRGEDGEDKLIPVSELASEVNGGTYRKRVRWSRAVLPSEALLHVYDRHTLLKMPENGMYEGFVYYLPNGMAPLDKDGSIMVRIPEDRKIEIKNGMTGEKEELTVAEWSRLVSGKTSLDYTVKREVPEDERKFLETAEKIRSALPPEMLAEASWIPVKVTESKLDAPEDRLRPGKVAVAPDKRFSGYEAGYKNIGTDFDKAVRAGRYEGATLMGYCFTKDSDVACIELDKCLNKDGTPKTEKAKEILEKLDGTYTERSYSGEGLHIFGKLSDPKIETLSKDADAEIFAGCGYIALTGDVVKSPNTLAPLDEGYMKKFIEENFGERKETPKPTEEDKKILDKMFGGCQGDDFKAVYNGENVRGGKEFCDASLAMRLSSVSGCDTKAVLRLYNASKREDKDPELVTHIVKRAADKVTDMLSDMKKPPKEDVSVRMEKLRKEREEREKFERRMKKHEGPTM